MMYRHAQPDGRFNAQYYYIRLTKTLKGFSSVCNRLLCSTCCWSVSLMEMPRKLNFLSGYGLSCHIMHNTTTYICQINVLLLLSANLWFSFAQMQVIMLSRFIETSRVCRDIRNFAGCLAILDGLENILVRQLPVGRGGEYIVLGWLDRQINISWSGYLWQTWMFSTVIIKNCSIILGEQNDTNL